MPTTQPLLNLTVDDKVKTVVVNNTPYELIEIQRFDLRKVRDFHRIAVQIRAFYSNDVEMTDEMLDTLDELLRQMIPEILPDLPESLRDRMSIMQRMEIMEVFLTQSALITQEPSTEPVSKQSSTTPGNRRSRRLSASTAGR